MGHQAKKNNNNPVGMQMRICLNSIAEAPIYVRCATVIVTPHGSHHHMYAVPKMEARENMANTCRASRCAGPGRGTTGTGNTT
eukprot:5442635-Pyramimonas_sp.AAC.1